MINCSFYKFSHYLSLEIYFASSNSSRSLSIPTSPLPTHTQNIYVYICVCVCVCVAFVYWLNHVHLFCDPMDCSLPGSSIHRISQARVLEWLSMPSSRGYSPPRGQTCVSSLAGRFFTTEPPGKLMNVCVLCVYLNLT